MARCGRSASSKRAQVLGDEQVAQALHLTLVEAVATQVRGRAAELAVRVLERVEHAFGRRLEGMGPALPLAADPGNPDAAFGHVLGPETLGAQRVVRADYLAGHPCRVQQ